MVQRSESGESAKPSGMIPMVEVRLQLNEACPGSPVRGRSRTV